MIKKLIAALIISTHLMGSEAVITDRMLDRMRAENAVIEEFIDALQQKNFQKSIKLVYQFIDAAISNIAPHNVQVARRDKINNALKTLFLTFEKESNIMGVNALFYLELMIFEKINAAPLSYNTIPFLESRARILFFLQHTKLLNLTMRDSKGNTPLAVFSSIKGTEKIVNELLLKAKKQ